VAPRRKESSGSVERPENGVAVPWRNGGGRGAYAKICAVMGVGASNFPRPGIEAVRLRLSLTPASTVSVPVAAAPTRRHLAPGISWRRSGRCCATGVRSTQYLPDSRSHEIDGSRLPAGENCLPEARGGIKPLRRTEINVVEARWLIKGVK